MMTIPMTSHHELCSYIPAVSHNAQPRHFYPPPLQNPAELPYNFSHLSGSTHSLQHRIIFTFTTSKALQDPDIAAILSRTSPARVSPDLLIQIGPILLRRPHLPQMRAYHSLAEYTSCGSAPVVFPHKVTPAPNERRAKDLCPIVQNEPSCVSQAEGCMEMGVWIRRRERWSTYDETLGVLCWGEEGWVVGISVWVRRRGRRRN